jgi:hypothetical protein
MPKSKIGTIVCPNEACGKRVNVCAAQFANGEPSGDVYIGFHSHDIVDANRVRRFSVECPYSGKPLRRV